MLNNAHIDLFQGPDWNEFVETKIAFWVKFYKIWLDSCKAADILVIFYEELSEDLEKVSRKIVNFLHKQLDKTRLQCLLKHSKGNFQRESKELPFKAFSEAQKSLIQRHAKELNAALLLHKKPALPQNYYFYNVQR